MALTLVEASKLALGKDETALAGTIMELYASSSDLLQYMPFMTITGNAISFNRELTLPTAAYRGVNQGYTENTAEFEKVTDTLAIMGGDIDIDKYLIDTSGVDVQASQENAQVKALSLYHTKQIIKGDVTSTPRGFDGLQIRCTGNQLIAQGATGGGDALTLTKLDEVIDAVENPTHIIMNKTLRRRLSGAARSSSVGGYITYTMDSFGRRVTRYNDLPIAVVDKDESNADVMAFSEAAASGSSVCTSVYVVSFMENGTVGIQNGDMDVRDLGEIESKPVYRKRIEWYVGLSIMGAKAAARLRYIKDAAVAA